MNSSDSPIKIIKAFGVNGLKNTIPVDSSTSTDNNGIATFDKGFPQITMQPLSAGGIPPSGKDVNGVLYSVTIQQQWQNAGMGYLFDSTYATNISGYPQGSTIPSSDYSGFWINTTNGNTNNPEGTTALPTGWVPGYAYGSSAVTISTANVNVSDILAAKDRIILTGTLTGNRILYLPQWIKDWTIENNCTGSGFSVIVSTRAAGATVQSIPGTIINIHSDGTNITNYSEPKGKATFLASGSFVAPQGVTRIKVTVTAGGGSGSGCRGTSTSQTISGSGGGAGGTVISWVNVVPGNSYPVVVGQGGAAVTGATNGISGSSSSFNGSVLALGGSGGTAGGGGGNGGSGSGADIVISGGDGSDGQSGDFIFAGNGGSSFWGGGSRAGNGGPGRAAVAFGSGGGGVYDRSMSGNSLTSGSGAQGIVVIEY